MTAMTGQMGTVYLLCLAHQPFTRTRKGRDDHRQALLGVASHRPAEFGRVWQRTATTRTKLCQSVVTIQVWRQMVAREKGSRT